MGSPTTTTSGATCLHVQIQDHLGIDGTEDNGVNTATSFYLIEWSKNANTAQCRGCTDGNLIVPTYGDVYPYMTSLYCRRVEIRPCENNNFKYFQARVEYSDDLSGATNPLSAPPVVTWDIGEDGQVPYFIDNDPAGAKPCVNKAGERFADFLQRYAGTVTANFAINIPITGTGSWNLTTAGQIFSYCTPIPAVNSDSFTFDSIAISAGYARMRGCSISEVQVQNGVKYRVKKFQVAFKSTWNDVVDNRGFNALYTQSDGTNKLQEIVKGTPPTKPDSPWPLYPSGHAMPNVTDIPTPQLTFYPYPQKAFSALGFS